jgi:hypothetical protein
MAKTSYSSQPWYLFTHVNIIHKNFIKQMPPTEFMRESSTDLTRGKFISSTLSLHYARWMCTLLLLVNSCFQLWKPGESFLSFLLATGHCISSRWRYSTSCQFFLCSGLHNQHVGILINTWSNWLTSFSYASVAS